MPYVKFTARQLTYLRQRYQDYPPAHFAEAWGVGIDKLYELARRHGIKRRAPNGAPEWRSSITQTRIAPPPTSGQYANGGILGKNSASVVGVGVGQVVVQAADLSALVNNTSAMLTHLQGINAATNATAAYGPASLQIGPYEATKIHEEKQKADQAQGFATV